MGKMKRFSRQIEESQHYQETQRTLHLCEYKMLKLEETTKISETHEDLEFFVRNLNRYQGHRCDKLTVAIFNHRALFMICKIICKFLRFQSETARNISAYRIIFHSIQLKNHCYTLTANFEQPNR